MVEGIELVLQGGPHNGSFVTVEDPAPEIITLPPGRSGNAEYAVYHLWHIRPRGRGSEAPFQRYLFDHTTTEETGDLLPAARIFRPKQQPVHYAEYA